MDSKFSNKITAVQEINFSFFETKCGLIEVSGAEAVQFLNGLITNDVKTLETDRWMLAAFPNAQGRLLAVVRVLRLDEKFLFVTDEQTRGKVFQNLFRFTFAGDFKVRDLTEEFSCFFVSESEFSNFGYKIPINNEISGAKFNNDEEGYLIKSFRVAGFEIIVPKTAGEDFTADLKNVGAIELDDQTREVLRIESGIPKFGVDMDETTIVPELGIAELISYNKGCYIGQEIIARIHFRGHVAKQLTGIIFEDGTPDINPNDELKSTNGKNAGRITSLTFSPALKMKIALAYIRYDYLAEGTELQINETTATVKHLPFI